MMARFEKTEAPGDSLRESGITLERRDFNADPTGARMGFLGSLSAFWRRHHQEITSIAVLLGLLATFLQLRASINQFDEQMAQNRRATATLLVSDFLNQVGDIVMSGEEEEAVRRKLDKVVASRANLLLEELEFTEPRTQVLRFLASSDYGRLIGKKPVSNAPGINLKNIPLFRSNLSGTDFQKANIFCALLGGSQIGDSDLSNTTVLYTDLSGTILGNAKFINARLDHVDLRESTIEGTPKFLDAEIVHSDLTGMRVTEAVVRDIEKSTALRANGPPGKTLDDDGHLVVRDGPSALAFLLADARSLEGSRLDDAVKKALRDELAARGEADRFELLAGNLADDSTSTAAGVNTFTPCQDKETQTERPSGESSLNVFARLSFLSE